MRLVCLTLGLCIMGLGLSGCEDREKVEQLQRQVVTAMSKLARCEMQLKKKTAEEQKAAQPASAPVPDPAKP